MQSVILILAFATVFTLIIAIYQAFTAKGREMADRINRYTKTVVAREQKPRVPFSWKDLFEKISKLFAPRSISQKVEAELAKAAIPLRGEEYIFINTLTTLVPFVIISIFAKNIPGGLAAGLLGFVLPHFFLRRGRQKRLQRFNAQISEALVVMANSLRAGFSFLQAMEMVGKEMPAPIAEEFSRTLREIHLGTQTEEALTHMAARMGSDDLDLILTAVLIQRQAGGNLAEILDKISFTIRERIRIQGEIRTLTAQGRMSGLIIGALPVAIGLFLLIIYPDYMKPLYSTAIGLAILAGGITSQVVGVLIIKKIISINV